MTPPGVLLRPKHNYGSQSPSGSDELEPRFLNLFRRKD